MRGIRKESINKEQEFPTISTYQVVTERIKKIQCEILENCQTESSFKYSRDERERSK